MSGSSGGFTPAEVVQVRRWCGYPPLSRLGGRSDDLSTAMSTLSAEEIADARTVYLSQLATLESAIPAAGANLDTDKAAVWERNKTEAQDRERLFRSWRLRLCWFFGVPSGPYLDVVLPASFVV